MGIVAGAHANFKGHTLNIAHNKLLHVKALVAEILQMSVTSVPNRAKTDYHILLVSNYPNLEILSGRRQKFSQSNVAIISV